jgi:hypothetical protein
MGYPMPKVGVAMKLGCPATLAGRSSGQVGPLSPTFGQSTDLTPYKYPHTPLGRRCEESEVLLSIVIPC